MPPLLALTLLVAAAGDARAWETLVSGTPPASRAMATAVFPNEDIVAVGRAATTAALDDAIATRLAAGSGAELWRVTLGSWSSCAAATARSCGAPMWSWGRCTPPTGATTSPC